MSVAPTVTSRAKSGRGQSSPRIAAFTALATGLAGLMMSPVVPAQAAGNGPTTTQLSVWTGGFAPDLGSNGEVDALGAQQVSDNGRYVAMSVSGPIVPGQQQLSWQVVLRDRLYGTSTLISKSTAGRMGNASSGYPSISADGSVVAFHSHASNLVAGDTNNASDVFVHEVATGRTTRASVTSAGAQVPVTGPGDNVVGNPTLSADGNHVGFLARSAGYTGDDGNTGVVRAYVRDLRSNQIEVVSRNNAGAVVGALAGSMAVPSADGSVVAFRSIFHNNDPAVFVRNRTAGTTTMVPSGSHGVDHFQMSPNGRFVVYDSRTGHLGAVQPFTHVFIHDLQTSTTTRASLNSSGTPANGPSSRPVVSNNGRYVAFQSGATNLVTGDTNGKEDVFRHDRTTGQTTRMSVANNGAQTTGYGSNAAISGDGHHVVFVGQAGAFTPVTTHGYRQYFVRDLAGRYAALTARVPSLPGRKFSYSKHVVAVQGIRTGPPLVITWKPGKGATSTYSAPVSASRFTLRAPKAPGAYTVSITYAGHRIGGRTITVVKPRATLATRVKARKALHVRTYGLPTNQPVNVQFVPRGKTRGATLSRNTKVKASGVATVVSPPRRGTYRVVVRAMGMVLRSANLTVT